MSGIKDINEKYGARRKGLRRRRSVVTLLGAFVVIAISAALMVPGVSATKDALSPDDQDTSAIATQEIAEESADESADSAEAAEQPAEEEAETPEAEVQDETAEPAEEAEADVDNAAEDAADNEVDNAADEAEADPETAANADDEPEESASSVGNIDPKSEDDDKPAQSFKASLKDANGNVVLTVAVDAPEGAFPAGTFMEIDGIAADKVEDKVAETIKKTNGEEAKIKSMTAVDIVFKDAEGNEIEPAKKVEVKITTDDVRDYDNPVLVHVLDKDKESSKGKNDDAELIKKVEIVNQDEDDSSTGAEDTMKFESKAFSPYVIVALEEELSLEYLSENGATYEVKVSYADGTEFPAGYSLKVEDLVETSRAYLSARKAVVEQKQAADEDFDEETLGMAAVDISIVDESGNEVEPEGEVNMSVKVKSLPEALVEANAQNTLEFLHLNTSSGEAVVETLATAADDNMAVDEQTAEIDVTLDSFSIFPLTWTTGSATIHYGLLENGAFTEFEEDKVALLDTTASSISLENNFDGYSCYGAYYKETADSDDSKNIKTILHKTDAGWVMQQIVLDENGHTSLVEASIKNGSHIYVVYGEKKPHDSGADDPDVHGPTTTKEVVNNGDGTATIQLDVTAPIYQEVDKEGANVIVVLDTTRSMSYSMSSDQAPADWHNNRMEAARAALQTLVNTLDMNKNEINFALAEFNLNGSTHTWGSSDWTTNPNTILSYVSDRNQLNYTTSTSGTNWEIGLRQGQGLLTQAETDENLKKNKTYVIFVTDGQPNRWVGYPARWNNDYSHIAEAVSYAQDEATNVAGRSSFYGVFCGSSDGYDNLDTLVNNAGGVDTINARSAQEIQDAFQNIAHTIVTNLGSSNVSVDDGITELSSISAQIPSGTTGGYEYYKKGPNDSDFVTWTDAPGASFSDDNGVTWDLSEVGVLAKDTTYRVKFTVWPSQEAFDIIANLNNGTVKWDDLDQTVKDQINKPENDGQPYTLKTNTHLFTTYTYNGETYTDPFDMGEGTLDLEPTKMNVRKAFAHDINEQDPYSSIEFYLLVDGKYYQKNGTTSATLDDNNVFKLPVNAGNSWTNSVFIAPGVMKDGLVLETGHNYCLDEKILVGNEYEYEFTPQTVRPMEISGKLHYLVLVDKYNPAPNGATKIYIDDSARTYRAATDSDTENVYYYVESESQGELVGTNRKTAELDITKTIVDNTGNFTEEQLDNETFTYRVMLTVPAGSDISGITAYEYVARWDDAPAEGSRYTVFGYQSNEDATVKGIDSDVSRFSGKIYGGYTVTTSTQNRQMTDMFTENADGTMTATIDITLKRKEIIRFTNLPADTQYTITEMYNNYRQADPSRDADAAGSTMAANIADMGYTTTVATKSRNPVTETARTGSAEGTSISGTVDYLDVRYYNQFTNTLNDAIDVELTGTKHLDGYEWSGERYYFNLATTNDAPMPVIGANGRVRFYLTEASGSADKSYSFGKIRFTEAGTYTYTITEDNAGTTQIVNGNAVQFGPAETITIVIAENNGKLSVESVTNSSGNTIWNAETKVANTTITNCIPTTEVNATKEWKNADGSTTPPAKAQVTFTLYSGGTATQNSVVLNGVKDAEETADWVVPTSGGYESEPWKAAFVNLPKYEVVDGEAKEIVYTVGETVEHPGYTKSPDNPVANGGTITNEQSTLWVQFKKTNMTNEALSGAVFSFNDGSETPKVLTSENNGIMATSGTESVNKFQIAIQDAPYTLIETTAPGGYNKLTDDVYVYAKSTGVSATLGNATPPAASYTVTGTGTEDDPYVVTITNSAGVELPMTGGPGTVLLTAIGTLMVILGGAALLLNRRRNSRQAF